MQLHLYDTKIKTDDIQKHIQRLELMLGGASFRETPKAPLNQV